MIQPNYLYDDGWLVILQAKLGTHRATTIGDLGGIGFHLFTPHDAFTERLGSLYLLLHLYSQWLHVYLPRLLVG